MPRTTATAIDVAVTIRPIEIVDSADLRAAHAVLAETSRAAYTGAPEPFTFTEFLVRSRPTTWEGSVLFGAFADAECVGVAAVELPLTDNLEAAFAEIAVPPRFRRRGVGAVLYEAVLDVCRDHCRTKIMFWLEGDADQDPTNVADWHDGARFAEHRGITLRNVEVHRRLDLPLDDCLLDQLATEAKARQGDYRIESWVGKVPEDYREQYAKLIGQLVADAPTGTLDVEPMEVDRERLEYDMDAQEQMGRTSVVAVAIAADGSLAGQSEIAVPSTVIGPSVSRETPWSSRDTAATRWGWPSRWPSTVSWRRASRG